MKRQPTDPRADWQKRCESIDFDWHTIGGHPYWREDACYVLTAAEVDALEAATQELHDMCMTHVAEVVRAGDYAGYGFDDRVIALIEQSWLRKDRSLYGRFDLAVVPGSDGLTIKMFEFNADTPTSLYEAAVVQWRWLEDLGLPDQFNSIHEKLVARWRSFGITRAHLCAMRDAGPEDAGTLGYMAECAAEAGISVSALVIEQIGWNASMKTFVDAADRPIDNCFKLYPWEWMCADQFGANIRDGKTRWVEPAWKMLLSTKALLPLLWRKHPDHPLLLESYFAGDGAEKMMRGQWVKKPIYSREGANVFLVEEGRAPQPMPGMTAHPYYGQDGYIGQRYVDIPSHGAEDLRPVVGSWVVGDEPAGIGIREAAGVTGNTSCFVPHYFV